MSWIILLGLVGLAVYLAMSWSGGSGQSKSENKSFKGQNPYKSDGGSQDRPQRQAKVGGGYAKWVGGGLGWAFGGPIGGILGFVFGKMFEDMNRGGYAYQPGTPTQSGDFQVSLLVLSAAVMKSDGSVKKTELEYVRRFFATNFGSEAANQYVLMLREILKQEIQVSEVGRQIGSYMDYSSRLQLLHYLFGLSMADGSIHANEMKTIQSISSYMGISTRDFDSIKAMFVKETNHAYRILEIDPEATNEEVKKAYRNMAIKFHPDKVSHLGEEVRKAAEDKFQKLNAAYEEIKKQRGIH